MTEQEINTAIAQHCGDNWYTVEKGGWYYRANGCGYTNRIEEAGRYSHEDAVKELVRGEPMSVVKIPALRYYNDLNAMHEAEKTLTDIEYKRYCLFLDDLCVDDRGYGYPNWGRSATALQRCESFLKTIDKWKE